MATQAAFTLCSKRVIGAMKHLPTLALMPGGQKLIESLAEADVILKDPTADMTALNLDPFFALCAKVMRDMKAFNDVAEAAEFAVAFKALEDRYATAAGLMASWLDPGNDSLHFFLKMENLASDSGKLNWRTLDLAHDLLDDVFVAVNYAKMNNIESRTDRPYRGWQVDKDGNPARFSDAFRATPVCAACEVWLNERPAATANYRDIKAWIDRGFKLKDQLEAPWGMCECGKYKLLPWYDEKAGIWKINSLCRDCHKAKNGTSGKSAGPKGQSEHRQAGLSAETIEALQNDSAFDGVTVETRRESVIGGSAVKADDRADDPDMATVIASCSKAFRVVVNPADVEEDALVAEVEPIGKKREPKAKTVKVKKVSSEAKTSRVTKTKTPAKAKTKHPIEAVDGTL